MKKILIIEDEKLQASAFEKSLSKLYDIFITPNGKDGLDKAIDWQPDLILLDIILPGDWNGMEVLRQLKANPLTALIPVIVLTNLDKEQAQTARSLGAVDYLLKAEHTLEQIQQKIAQHLAQPQTV